MHYSNRFLFVSSILAVSLVLSGCGSNETTSNLNTNQTPEYSAADFGWSTYADPAGDFTVAAPVVPTVETETSPIPGLNETAELTYYTAQESDGTTYFVMKSVFPDSLPLTNTDQNLTDGLQGMLNSNPNNQLTSSTLTYYGSYRAMDFLINNTIDGVTMNGKAILVDHTLYTVMVAHDPVSFNPAKYQAFVDSFDLQ